MDTLITRMDHRVVNAFFFNAQANKYRTTITSKTLLVVQDKYYQ